MIFYRLRKKILALTLAFTAIVSTTTAAVVEYTPRSVVSFSETTPWGDICIIFTHCQANKLFTFSRVNLDGVIVNDATYSDNIGPFLTGYGWVGGNHLDSSGGTTANTLDVEIRLDGAPIDLRHDLTADCKVMTVKVMNQLGIGTIPIAVETITYTVSGNSIEVEAEHEFSAEFNKRVITYYGMQSMMWNERLLLLPGTGYCGWIPSAQTISLVRSEAPDFNVFFEKSGRATQATLLLDENLGQHDMVNDDLEVFCHTYPDGKSYHVLMRKANNCEHTRWHGIYSWFREAVYDTFPGGKGEADDASEDMVPVTYLTYGAYVGGAPVYITAYGDGQITMRPYSRPTPTIRTEDIQKFDGGFMVSDHLLPRAEVYDSVGRRYSSDSGTYRLPAGCYIMHNGSKSRKIVVR